jgi:NHLM bacteriocin system ABC transporter peptidase/ATP-binding protein
MNRVRTPTVLQMEAVECGAAALSITLAYYGRWVPLEELRVATGVSRDGAKASNIVKAARTYGMEAKGLKMEADEALRVPKPFTVFWNFNHFLVVEGQNDKYVYINDPATGPRRISHKEFEDGFTGVVLDMRPGSEFKKGGERRSLTRSLKSRLKGSESALAFIILVTLMLVVPGLLLPAFLKNFIDDVLTRGDNTWLLPILVGLALTAAFSSLLTYLQQRYLLRVRTKLAISSASGFFWHVLRLPVVFYTQRYVGDVASRVQSCHKLASLLSGPLSTAVSNNLTIVFYAAVMAVYSWILTLIAVGLAAINIAALTLVRRRLKDINTHLLNQQAKLVGASMVGVQAIETLKATGTESDFFRIWSGYQTQTINGQQSLGGTTQLLSAVPGTLSSLTGAIILGVGGLLIIQGELTIGGLIAFQSLMGHFSGPLQQLVGFGSQMEQVHGDLDRLDDVLRYDTDPLLHAGTSDDAPEATGTEERRTGFRKLSGELELREVSFGYDPLAPPLITGFNLHMRPGQRIALVGGSGSGKTTVTRLILGLYQPNAGTILLDGQPFQEIPRTVVTGSLGSVSQDISFFEGSVRDNLTLWDPTIPKAAVIRAAEDAMIHEEIASRPGGYESLVAEGNANFSGGQAQRLEIARALARDPTLLVLDEATAALDPITEKKVDDNLRRRGITCVIVAHRVSTIRDCDEIIVLDRGKIVERGNHDELMRLDGRYAQLVKMQ